MLGPVVEMLEAKFKTEGIIDLSNYSLTSLFQMAIEVIQDHRRIPQLKKHIKHIEKTSL